MVTNPYYVQSKLKKILFLSKYLGKKNYKVWILMQDSRDYRWQSIDNKNLDVFSNTNPHFLFEFETGDA